MAEIIVSCAGHSVSISTKDQQAIELLNFMFEDIPDEQMSPFEARFALQAVSDQMWEVSKEGEMIAQISSLTDAGNLLMGEVVYHLIENNCDYMALHAALLSDRHGGILMPGQSGNGKSSLAIWMTLNGYHYHTDELVLVKAGSLQAKVFTRPFNIKSYGHNAIAALVDIEYMQPSARRGDFITMIPHRALNPDYLTSPPLISRILFPKFDDQGDNQLIPLTRAAAGIELMKTNVIARNLPGHGFEQLLDIVKRVPAWQLQYNHFDALDSLLAQLNASDTEA